MVERKITYKFTTLDFGIERKLISWETKPIIGSNRIYPPTFPPSQHEIFSKYLLFTF